MYNDFRLEEYNLDVLTIWWVMPLISYNKNYIIIEIMSSNLSGFLTLYSNRKLGDSDLNNKISSIRFKTSCVIIRMHPISFLGLIKKNGSDQYKNISKNPGRVHCRGFNQRYALRSFADRL